MRKGDPIVELHYRRESDLAAALDLIGRAIEIADEPPKVLPLDSSKRSSCRGRRDAAAVSRCAFGPAMRRQSWPGSSAPGSGSADLTVALRADPVRACLSGDSARDRPRADEPRAGAEEIACEEDRIEEARSRPVRAGPSSSIVGGAVLVAVVAALLAQYGGVPRAQALVGLVVILGIAYLMSTNRRAIDLTTVAWGLGLQIVFALLVLKTDTGQVVFQKASDGITKLLSFADVGSSFVFGPLGNKAGVAEDHDDSARAGGRAVQHDLRVPGAADHHLHRGAVRHPLLLRHHAVRRARSSPGACGAVMKASGAESLNVAASIFMGQTEAPLTIRPYLPEMTESELMTVMTSGMAHISGGIMAAYILFGIEAKHLLTAVIMTAPGTLMMAKMFVPETESPKTMGTVKLDVPKTDVNVIDAAGRGTGEGLHLALNVGAMLISFLALVALVNAMPRARRPQPAADSRVGVRAGGVGDGRAVEGRADDRQPARARAWC